MDLLFELQLTNNPALASYLLSVAVKECYELREQASGVEFPLIFIVLPLVFHKDTAKAMAKKQYPGALVKALSENREIPLGLQERMEGFAELTLSALNISFAAEALYLDVNGTIEIIPGKISTPGFTHPDTKMMVGTAKRVGISLAELNSEQICRYLDIRF